MQHSSNTRTSLTAKCTNVIGLLHRWKSIYPLVVMSHSQLIYPIVHCVYITVHSSHPLMYLSSRTSCILPSFCAFSTWPRSSLLTRRWRSWKLWNFFLHIQYRRDIQSICILNNGDAGNICVYLLDVIPRTLQCKASYRYGKPSVAKLPLNKTWAISKRITLLHSSSGILCINTAASVTVEDHQSYHNAGWTTHHLIETLCAQLIQGKC